MSRFFEDRDTKAMSPVYDVRPATMAAGLPCDELCRSLYRAREMRRASLRGVVSHAAVPAGRLAGEFADAFSRWVDGLHRGPFTSTI